jgi:hypothetical protein
MNSCLASIPPWSSHLYYPVIDFGPVGNGRLLGKPNPISFARSLGKTLFGLFETLISNLLLFRVASGIQIVGCDEPSHSGFWIQLWCSTLARHDWKSSSDWDSQQSLDFGTVQSLRFLL